MNGSRDNYEKAEFGPDLARFGPISGEREFFAKIQLRHFLALKDLCHHAKNQKNLMNRY